MYGEYVSMAGRGGGGQGVMRETLKLHEMKPSESGYEEIRYHAKSGTTYQPKS